MRKFNGYYIAAVVATVGSFLVDFYYNTTYWSLAFSSIGIGYAYNGWTRAKYEVLTPGGLDTKGQARVLSRLKIFSVTSFVALISLAAAFVIVVEQTSGPDLSHSFSPIVVGELGVLASLCYGLLTLGSAEAFLVLSSFLKQGLKEFYRPTYAAVRLPLCFGFCLLGSLLMLYGAHTVFATPPPPGTSATPEEIFFFVGLALWGPTAIIGFVAFAYAVPAGLRRLGSHYQEKRLRLAGTLFWIPIVNLVSPLLLYDSITRLVGRLEATAAIPWGSVRPEQRR